ncbi:MAG TPA: trypsin-like peptidase domain-containing protein [Opitutaceae bacterium]|jgi:S1-C subfamily serine protease
MRLLPAAIATLSLLAPALLPAATPAPAVESSVVKVFSTVRNPDVTRPWTKQAPSDITGSGVVIDGKRILTNAHVVLYASQVQVQANLAGDKISARVEYIAPSIDLAVLRLDDESFFDTHPPLPRSNAIPAIKDTVLVYGFPVGGNSLSITKGIVSRIEFASYNYPVWGLRIQVDAAINHGNSGGPAAVDGKMIGLAFSGRTDAENIGYIIPTEEIEFFLGQAASGAPYAKPAVYDDCQTLENSALRPYLKLKATDTGTLVENTDSPDPSYPLRKWDLISRIGDTPIDDQGMIHQGDLRLDFHYLVRKAAHKGKVSLEIVRDGRRMRLDVPVYTGRPLLENWLEGEYPRYFIYGPLVFSPATGDIAEAIINTPGIVSPILLSRNPALTRRGEVPAFPGEELVIVASPFLPNHLVDGYSNHQATVVSRVNGVPVRNLGQMVEVLRDATSEFVTFEFSGRGFETLVFPRRKLLAATDDILSDNGIREQGSPEYMAIWNRHGTAK